MSLLPKDSAPLEEWQQALKDKEKEYREQAHENRKNWTGTKFTGRNAGYMNELARSLQKARDMIAKKIKERKSQTMETTGKRATARSSRKGSTRMDTYEGKD